MPSHTAFYSFVDCSSLKLIIKGEKKVQPQQKKMPSNMKTFFNVVTDPFERVIIDYFGSIVSLAKQDM